MRVGNKIVETVVRQRKNIRLSNFDYSQNGMYFITICTKDREEFFGKIEKGRMILNKLGEIAEKCLKEVPSHFKGVFLDGYVVMPNHVHFIVEIINQNVPGVGAVHVKNVGADLVSAQNKKGKAKNKDGQAQGLSLQNNNFSCNKNKFGLLSEIIRVFKSKCVVEYIKFLKETQWDGCYKIWQRSFHDRIIRNEIELNKIREYIIKNPEMWAEDENNLDYIV